MSLRLTVFASGSSGNCACVETETTRLLVDAGLSGRQIEERLAGIGRSISDFHGILVTHEHSDHVLGLRVLASRHRIPIFANRLTREAVLLSQESNGNAKAAALDWRIFETGQGFAAGDFDIEPFSIPHDAADPVGFLIQHGGRCVVFLTDLGHATRLALDKAGQADTLILETNHDVKMLQDDPKRPWSLKQRILGKHGHLSNEAGASVLAEIMTDRLQHVYLAHLSEECNRPELAESTVRKKLAEIGAGHVRVTVAGPARSCASETLEPSRPLKAETLPLFERQAVR